MTLTEAQVDALRIQAESEGYTMTATFRRFAVLLQSAFQAEDLAVGVDVMVDGTHVMVRRENEIIYSQFHPSACQAGAQEAAINDCLTYGTGVMKDGKHVPYSQMVKEPAHYIVLEDTVVRCSETERHKLLEQGTHLYAAPQQLSGVAEGWISVDDRLPDFDVLVWLVNKTGSPWIGGRSDDADGWLWGNCYQSAYFHDGKWQGDIECDDDYSVTHWMPLPAALTPPVTGKE